MNLSPTIPVSPQASQAQQKKKKKKKKKKKNVAMNLIILGYVGCCYSLEAANKAGWC